MKHMNKIITIGRQFGSGGHEVGEKLAERLGFAFYDKNLITLAAEKGGLNHGSVRGGRKSRQSLAVRLNGTDGI